MRGGHAMRFIGDPQGPCGPRMVTFGVIRYIFMDMHVILRGPFFVSLLLLFKHAEKRWVVIAGGVDTMFLHVGPIYRTNTTNKTNQLLPILY